MHTKRMRCAAGLLCCTAFLTAAAPPAHAAGVQAPWFGSLRGAGGSHTDPFYLARRYVPFWCYVEGFAWVEYTQWRASLLAVPSIYAARPATPLPTLPAQPDFVARVIRAVVPAAQPAEPAPVVKHDEPAPVVEADEPAPAPDTDQPVRAPGAEETAPVPEAGQTAPAPGADEPEQGVPAPEADTTAHAPETDKTVPAPDADQTPPATGADPSAPAPDADQPSPEAEVPKPEAHAPVTLAPAPAQPAPAADALSDSERTLISLVNAERSKAGLPSLQVDPRLVETARAKSADMAQSGYFAHTSPTLGTPFEQIKAAGIPYRIAAENIAGNQSVTGAHTALMNSPGHRSNMLKPEFTKIGIGIYAGGHYGLMVTQQFIGE